MQLATFTKGLDKVSEWTGRIFMWLIIPLTLVVVYEVVSTKFFNAPHIWAPEVIAYLYGPYFMMVAAYTLLYKAHVRIDIIYMKFSPRTRGILDCFTYLIFFSPSVLLFFSRVIFTRQPLGPCMRPARPPNFPLFPRSRWSFP
jgi:TRAP-type mannitol/chloroaromatic compound transport system permease small subunit